MSMMFIIAGLVVGLLVFLRIRRKWNAADKAMTLNGVKLLCPDCAVEFKADECWRRSGLRGDFFDCSSCGRSSIWNTKVKPPKLKR